MDKLCQEIDDSLVDPEAYKDKDILGGVSEKLAGQMVDSFLRMPDADRTLDYLSLCMALTDYYLDIAKGKDDEKVLKVWEDRKVDFFSQL